MSIVPHTPAVPALDRYREIHAARVAREETERQAAEQQKRAKEAAKLAEQTAKMVKLAEHLFGPALGGWEVVTDANSWDHRRWGLRRAFGEDVVEIACECKYADHKLNRVHLATPDGGMWQTGDVWVNFEQPDHAAAEAAIAVIVVPALENLRRQREYEEQCAAEEQARTERLARANARLVELVTAAEEYQAGCVEGLTTKYGWPEGATLTVWKLSWVMGVSPDGDESREEAFALSAEAEMNGLHETIGRDGIGRKAIFTPNAVTADERVWQSVDDLPYELRQTVKINRFCKVETGDGNSVSRYVSREVTLPGRTVRGILGLPTDEVKHVHDDVCEDADGNPVERAQGAEEDRRDLPW